jgi:hypothetical protein
VFREQQLQTLLKRRSLLLSFAIHVSLVIASNRKSIMSSFDFAADLEAMRREARFAVHFVVNDSNGGDMTCKWVYKNMPTSYRYLEANLVSYIGFLCMITETFSTEFPGFDPNSPGQLKSVVELEVLNTIPGMAIPTKFTRIVGTHRCSEAWVDKCTVFGRDLMRCIVDLDEEEGKRRCPRSHMEWMSLYKTAVDNTCRAFGPELDKLFFRGKKGTFLKKCPLYQKPERFYSSLLGEKPGREIDGIAKRRVFLHQKRNSIQKQLLVATRDISFQLLHSHKTCWECGVTAKTVQTCSSCEVALYCGSECQAKARKNGHKKECLDLKWKHEHFKNSLAIVTATHDKEIEEKCTPTYELDFKALDYCFSSGDEVNPWKGTQFEDPLANPSIESYFGNLERIRNGELWFFSQDANADYRSQLLSTRNYQLEEPSLHCCLETLLCHDYFGYLKQNGLPESAFDNIFTDCDVIKSLDKEGMRMPAWRFLELHDKFRDFAGTKSEGKKLRKEKTTESTKKFLKSVHPRLPYESAFI